MSTYIKHIVWVFFLALLVGNIGLFISGIRLSSDINRFETEIGTLRVENQDLEKKVYQIESLSYAASVSATLGYTKKAMPFYLENLAVALNR